MMKNILNIVSIALLVLLFTSCGKDNYDAPKSMLSGKITYNGEALNLRGTGEAVQLQLYQDGFAKHDPINVFVGQDGTFSAELFDGVYKMVTRDNNGPWINSRDTTVVTINGSAAVEMKVTPYFTISGENVTVSATDMNATFTINQIVSTAKLDKVILILSKTQFADDANNVFRKDISGVSVGPVNLSADITGNTAVSSAKALFARVAVKTQGVDQAIYSPVIRLR